MGIEIGLSVGDGVIVGVGVIVGIGVGVGKYSMILQCLIINASVYPPIVAWYAFKVGKSALLVTPVT